MASSIYMVKRDEIDQADMEEKFRTLGIEGYAIRPLGRYLNVEIPSVYDVIVEWGFPQLFQLRR